MYAKGTLATTGLTGTVLPFTGFNVLAVIVAAFTLIFAGFAIRRIVRTVRTFKD
jgi:hypothetical protein